MMSVKVAYGYGRADVKDASHMSMGGLTNEDIDNVKVALSNFDPNSVSCWVRTEDVIGGVEACLRKFEAGGGKVNWPAYRSVVNNVTHNPSHRAPCSTYFDKAT